MEATSALASKNVSWPPETTVLYPDDAGFTDATTRWNAYGSPDFTSVITPSSEEEVIQVVKIATANKIPFLAMGGRHGYGTTFSKLQDGLALDLSSLKDVKIDKASSTVTVGGGAKIRDVVPLVRDAGYQMPSGACSCTGFVGSTLGAGIGYMSGIFGLVIDALVSVRLVTAKGELVEASEKSNPDLFWGIRGAGANFGIVTSATYKLSKQINGGQVFYADLIFPATFKEQYFNIVEKFENRPAELGFSSAIFWDPASNSTVIMGTFIYTGPETPARELLKPFFDLNPPVARAQQIPFHEIPLNIMNGLIEAACDTKAGIHSIHTLNVRKFSAPTYIKAFDKIDAFYKKYPDARASGLILETFHNGAVSTVPDGATAYPWRDAKGNFMLQMRWPGLDNPLSEIANNFGLELRDDFQATSGYPELSAYVNYAWGDETAEQIYGRNKLPRLIALKKKWDPNNVFGYSNPIPTN
ncbi:hypothetical protein GGS23DRAFT_544560 [Durotheca rogersii]|uniref:uncharacterized protein n=1 Tax=Durotheca rogersii TaxID=419775 RepID=UPI00221F3BCB|nr:uncharacterized protein GGS23DRAFT_544560 [Durotheca rogersii]KAI5868214.1 hypothetical protein GGS23DRAFT_544560 [Durotheca rogersii]